MARTPTDTQHRRTGEGKIEGPLGAEVSMQIPSLVDLGGGRAGVLVEGVRPSAVGKGRAAWCGRPIRCRRQGRRLGGGVGLDDLLQRTDLNGVLEAISYHLITEINAEGCTDGEKAVVLAELIVLGAQMSEVIDEKVKDHKEEPSSPLPAAAVRQQAKGFHENGPGERERDPQVIMDRRMMTTGSDPLHLADNMVIANMGVDSITAIELVSEVRKLGGTLPAAFVPSPYCSGRLRDLPTVSS
ncbi:hypothetical protein DHEL01_v204810 [Diaporthe helianthi]|uniref:Carrier domain-containing protein n=1 Tax=Diaporthe helianthi TaxID=158607 RepID=A0A2P5I2R0_DIAHE|nr:hypothetical protein DHEL01_v204810 [Diaporthe helianthi]